MSDTTNVRESSTQPIIVRKRLHCFINGSIEDFRGMGQDAATWQPHNGKIAEVFGLNDVFESSPDNLVTTSTLQNAVLHKVTVLEQKNEFPLHLGVSISCIPSEEMTEEGNRFAITSLANSHNNTPCVVYSSEHDSEEGYEWRSKYPAYNAQNLETQGVLQVNGQNYVFVNENHPVIELLRQNKTLLNADIDSQQRIDGEWLKITKQVMSTCCQTLRNRVLNKVSTRDLNQFSLQISRIKSDNWELANNDAEIMRAVPIEIMVQSKSDPSGKGKSILTNCIDEILTKPYSYTARLEVEYEIAA